MSLANDNEPLDDGAGRQSNPRRELVREQLIDIAARMFNEKGYAETNFSDIARKMGLGRSALYHYFGSKEEILAALVESEALAPSQQLLHLTEDKSLRPSERLRRAITEGIIRRLSSGSRFLFLSRLETQIPEALLGPYREGRRYIYDFYVRCITEGIACGEFREVDAKIAAFAVIGMANWTSRWYSPKGQKTPQDIAREIADLALQSLVKPKTGAGGDEALRESIRALRAQADALEAQLP